MKIKLFLGVSGAGKTIYIEKNVIGNLVKEDFFIDKIKMCKAGNKILFGHYNVDRRCKGCDTLSMSIINDLIVLLDKLIKENQYEEIIIDGDRVNNDKMFNYLKAYKESVEVYFLNTSLEKVYERMPDCNKKFVQTTKTKTENMIKKYMMEGFKIIKIENKVNSIRNFF